MLIALSCGNIGKGGRYSRGGSSREGPPSAASSLLKGRQPQAILGRSVKSLQARGGKALDRVGGRFPPVIKCSWGWCVRLEHLQAQGWMVKAEEC